MKVSTSYRYIISVAALVLLSATANAATNQFSVTASSSQNYTINGVDDPTDITLVRGFTYFFAISAPGHPFYIKTSPGTGSGNAYNFGVSSQGEIGGEPVQFTVPGNAPDTLYYQCSIHFNMTGPLHIVDAPTVDITSLSIGTDLLLQSTGSDHLNLNVQSRSSLTNAWGPVAIQSNQFIDGTNTTLIALPAGDAAFFRIQQGFF